MNRVLLISLVLLTVPLAGCAGGSEDAGETGERIQATLTTNHGVITLELFGDLTPQTVKNFGSLAQEGFYDDIKFHRVIEGFMIQGGDPNTKQAESEENPWGAGGPGYTILDEFVCGNGEYTNEHPGRGEVTQCNGKGGFMLDHSEPGTLSMANTGQPRTGGSQFFITLGTPTHLDGRHTVFGQVTDGMDVVTEIGSVDTNQRDQPVEPVVIESIEIDGELPPMELRKF